MVRPLFFLFFASGFSGLIYESVWSHYLKLVLGHAAYAQTLVLSIYMGGLALGSYLASRFPTRNPVLVYGAIEAGVGLAAIGFHEIFGLVTEQLFLSWVPAVPAGLPASALRWVVCSLLILPQCVLLGATFPLMSAGILRLLPASSGRVLATLYFTNSIGAALGVLGSAFVLVPSVGLPGALLFAGLLNLAIGGYAVLWSRKSQEATTPELPASESTPRESALMAASSTLSTSVLSAFMLLAAGFTGLASFLYEVGWIRMLSLVLGSTTQAFELMLAAFIAGLGLGGLWVRRRIDRSDDPLRFAGSMQIAMGVCAALTIVLYERCFDLMGYFMRVLPRTDAGYTAFHLASQALAMGLMLPATFFAGTTLPLFTYVLLRKGVGERAIGHVYAANTLGAIAGVLLAVHVTLPGIGLQATIGLGAALDVLLGLVMYRLARGATPRLARAGVAATLLVLVLSQVLLTFDVRNMASGVFRSGRSLVDAGTEILFHEDGKTATVTTLRGQDGVVTIATNGKADASLHPVRGDSSIDEHTQIVAGALPLAMRPKARAVAVIGFGSGVSSYTVLRSSTLERVDTIEIEPEMIEGARAFGAFQRDTLADARGHIHIDDAKAFFARAGRRYDVIISEPSNPWVSGVASLFTEEFYETAHRYLANDGLLVQWVQCYETNFDIVTSVLKALAKTFPRYEVYTANGSDLIVVAAKAGGFSLHESVVRDPKLHATLARVGVRSAADLAVRRVGGHAIVRPFIDAGRAPSNSDYFPFVAHEAPRARFLQESAFELSLLPLAPVPVVDLLERQISAPAQALPASRFFAYAQAQRAAWELLRFAQSPEAALPSAASAKQIARLLALCVEPQIEPAVRLTALHALAAITTPFLRPEESMALWRSERVTACIARLGSSPWPPLYTALAARDRAGVVAAAPEALAHSPRIEHAQYALGALLAAQLGSGHIEDARRAAKQHAAVLAGSVPSYLAVVAAQLHAD